MLCNRTQSQKGLSIVEVIVVSGIVAVFFSGLLSSFYFTISLVQDSRARQTALSVASNQMEYIRSLSYDAVGTVAGIPAGAIPQTATSTLNGIDFTIRTLVEYVDDPADGIGVADANGITTDYKSAKVTVSWDWRGMSREVFLVSRVIPRSIETDVGGGTIRVNVFDATVQPLAGAVVQLVNTSATPAIDVTRTTNADGVALFGGAPAGAGYEISVTRDGYSTDSTYAITSELENPATPPATVAEADITTLNFFIDQVSTLSILTVSEATYEDWLETFASTTAITSGHAVVVSGGVLELAAESGSYAALGNASLQPVSPSSVESWGTVTIAGTTPLPTTRRIQVYTADASPVLVSDTDLPGNSTGFLGDTIDISGLDGALYPAIVLGVTLETTDTTLTPTVDEIEVSYVASVTTLGNVPLSIRGDKTIGTRSDATAVYKFSNTLTTNNAGVLTLSDVEWDMYTVQPEGYTITEACTEHPVLVAPGTAVDVRLTLVPAVSQALRVQTITSAGAPVSDAVVTLSRSGYSSTQETSPCGQTSFLPLGEFGDYTLTVQLNGAEVWSQSDIFITGNETLVIQLP